MMANVVSCWRRPRVRQCLVRVKPWRKFDRLHCRVFLQALHFWVSRWKGYSWEERNVQSCRGVLFDFLYKYMYNSYVLQRGISDFFIEPFAHTHWKKNYSVACHELNSQTLLLLLGTDFLSLFFCFRRLWFLGCFGRFVLLLFWSPCSGQCSSLSWEWYDHKRAIWSWRWMFNRWTSHTYSAPFLLCLALFPAYISYF